MESIGKKEVAAVMETEPEHITEVLALRQQLAKSSVSKYQAMQNAVCADGRARGMFQFYGANRSGRWAGRLIQLQNLPQNHMPDLVKNGGQRYSRTVAIFIVHLPARCSIAGWRSMERMRI